MLHPLFHQVVMATDLSGAWDQIVSCGGELLGLGCRRVVLTHVITPDLFGGLGDGLSPPHVSRLAAQRRSLEEAGLEVLIETPIGLPGASLNEVARKHDASLIVIGSHGRTRWREGVLGTFSSAVLHNIRFPLLVLPVQLDDRQEPGCLWRRADILDHLLFPTDFSQTAAEALCYLELLAPRGVNRVTLLHALPAAPDQGAADAAATARNFLDLLQGRLQAAGVPTVHTRTAVGHPVAVILETLGDTDVSLIVLGTQGKGSIAEISVGSVAHNISRFAPRPLLLIPPSGRDDGE